MRFGKRGWHYFQLSTRKVPGCNHRGFGKVRTIEVVFRKLIMLVALACMLPLTAACNQGTAAQPTVVASAATAVLDVPTAPRSSPTAITETPTTISSTPTAGDTAVPQATDTTSPTILLPPATPKPTMIPGTLIVFTTSGGFAGIQQVLTISDTGEVTFTDRGQPGKTGKLDSKQLSDLKSRIEAAGGITLKDRYDNGNVADDIYRGVTFAHAGVSQSSIVAEVGSNGTAPAELQALIDMLRGIQTGL